MAHLTRLLLLTLSLLWAWPAQASSSLATRVSLQATMQSHIDRASVDGLFLALDDDTGKVEALRPMAAHPIILRMGEFFVLCADFKGADGARVNVDFYLAPKDHGYTVFAHLVDQRNVVERLMERGEAMRFD